jgi:hypothetical protein
MKFGVSSLFQPTPIKIKVFGKAMVSACTTAAGLNTVNGGSVKISVALVIIGFVGQLLCEFFSKSETPDVSIFAEPLAAPVADVLAVKPEPVIASIEPAIVIPVEIEKVPEPVAPITPAPILTEPAITHATVDQGVVSTYAALLTKPEANVTSN